jgi:hypothetical protein
MVSGGVDPGKCCMRGGLIVQRAYLYAIEPAALDIHRGDHHRAE